MQKQLSSALLIMMFIIAAVSAASGSLFAHGQLDTFTADDFVTYEKKSSFINEFEVPVDERGLEGITADANGTIWFFYSTNTTSKVFNFDPIQKTFRDHQIQTNTAADNAVINLAAGHVVFDSKRNAVWFTDARTNSVGKIDITSGNIELVQIPTSNAGPMGIALSPDGMSIWLTEITGNKLARIDGHTMEIVEYSTGDDSGPALLTFDDKGVLWVSLSFSNSVLRVDPKTLSSSDPSSAMTEFKLPGGDVFSPFGIAVSGDKVYVSDHGSSRLVVTDTGFVNYLSYWTSPSNEFPTTLPSEVVADAEGNIYFPQHGGNRISMIESTTGVMTEYEIPTGPLSTAVFITPQDKDGKVWFTEWAANKIAYLDTISEVTFNLQPAARDITLTQVGSESIDISLESSNNNESSVSLSEVELVVTGMTESGLLGVTYTSQPQRVNLEQNQIANVTVNLSAEEDSIRGKYTIMLRAVAPEKDELLLSRLYPVSTVLDVPVQQPIDDNFDNNDSNLESTLRDLMRYGSLSVAIGLAAYVVYRRIKKKRIVQK